MTAHKMIAAGLVAGLATSIALVTGIAAAKEAAGPRQSIVLDLVTATSTGGGSGKVSLQDFSFSVARPATKGARAAASSSSSSCPSSSEAARWTAPELHSSSARSSGAALPPGAACVRVITAREAGSGMATGRRKGWDGCVKGTHIASAQIVHRDLAYRFTDLTVEECSADGMVLSYASATTASSSSSSSSSSAPAPAPAGVRHEVH